MDFLTFVTEKIKLVEPCLTPSPLNGQNNTKREERYLSTVPKIVPTLKFKEQKIYEENFVTFDLKHVFASCTAIRICLFLCLAESV